MNPITELRRRLRGKSQRKLADELDVPLACISDALTGRRPPGPSLLTALGFERATIHLRRRKRQPTNGS